MCSRFRLRLDLSYFFRDARQYSWIFVDETKIQQVIHLKQHIKKLFNIKDSFHLMLNDIDYLPPTEDIRILNGNETIIVAPGLGISDDTLNTSGSVSDIDTRNNFAKVETCNRSVRSECETTDSKITNKTGRCIPDRTLDDSNTNMILHDVNQVTEAESEIKAVENNLNEDYNVADSIVFSTKRKRVRRRRPKTKSEFVASSPNTINESNSNKPKIIDSVIIPSSIHVHFNNRESDEEQAAQPTMQEISHNKSSSNVSSGELSTLLALGENSTPVTFTNKRIKNEIKMRNVFDQKTKIKLDSKEDTSKISKDRYVHQEETSNKTSIFKHLMQADIEKMPVMSRMPQINDIIAFKTLKIGIDYTPHVSKFIVAQVVDCSVPSINYTLKIFDGIDEFKVPYGKQEDESAYLPGMIMCSYMQIIEPRLLT